MVADFIRDVLGGRYLASEQYSLVTRHKLRKLSLLRNKKWTKERRSFWKTLRGCVGVKRTMTAVARPPPPSSDN